MLTIILFGLDKMGNIPKALHTFEDALDNVLSECGHVKNEETA